MNFERDYPEPEEAVGQLIKWSSGDGEGVLRDALVEANSEAVSYKSMLQEVNVHLDHVCDDREGVFPPQMVADLRECQRHIQFTIEWLDEFALKAKSAHDDRFK